MATRTRQPRLFNPEKLRVIDPDADNPVPIQTVVWEWTLTNGRKFRTVIRRFPNAEARRCQLCRKCVFNENDDGEGLCINTYQPDADDKYRYPFP